MGKKIFAVLMSVLVCLPLLLYGFVYTDKSAEKRQLTAFPSITENGKLNTGFYSQIDSWFNDHFPFRSEIITAANMIKGSVFNTSGEKKVVVGSDDWLFFNETTNDYIGESRLSDNDIEKICATLNLVNEYVLSNNSKFIFCVAPNKNTIYGQFMPKNYIKSDTSNLDKLNTVLGTEDWYINLKDLLSASKNTVYHKRDSHWNNIGAAMVQKAVMERVNFDFTDFTKVPYTMQKNWHGDLDNMVYPSLNYLDEQAVFDYKFNHISNAKSEEDILINTTAEGKSRNLLMFRDSFGNALLPLFAEDFGVSKFSRATPYTLTDLYQNNFDLTVIEIAERNIKNLLYHAPLMSAPRREEPQGFAIADTTVYTAEKNGLVNCYGSLKNDVKQVYLKLDNGEQVMYFEAFPILEKDKLLKSSSVIPYEIGENGFSAYLDKSLYENYNLTVMYR